MNRVYIIFDYDFTGYDGTSQKHIYKVFSSRERAISAGFRPEEIEEYEVDEPTILEE